MPIGLLIPLLLLVIPILEIAVFIVVGGRIGVFPTLAMIFVTAVIGTILLRLQGFALITKIRGEMQANRLPGRELAHGAMLLAAGVLLLTPGFVTDAIGFLLFVPPLRDAILAFLASRVKQEFIVQAGGGRTGQSGRTEAPPPGAAKIVDLDPADFERKPDSSSPWNEPGSPYDDDDGTGSARNDSGGGDRK